MVIRASLPFAESGCLPISVWRRRLRFSAANHLIFMSLYLNTCICIQYLMRQKMPGRHAPKNQGALSNPAGRFERQQVESVDDGWYQDEVPASVEATLEPDRAREVISTNDSPDVPFEQSINPYRGCSHACIYCAAGDTQVLMAWGGTKQLAKLEQGDLIYGTVRAGAYRRYVPTTVLLQWSVVKPAYRITLEDGTELTVGSDHRFLSDRGWKFVTGTECGRARRPHLTTSNKLMGTGGSCQPVQHTASYRTGYLCGLIRGDGTTGNTYWKPNGGRCEINLFRLALCDTEALDRARRWLAYEAVETRQFRFRSQSVRMMHAIDTAAREKVQRVRELIVWPEQPDREWRAGFLAGIFDAEGSYNSGILRISNTNFQIINRIRDALRTFGFASVLEHCPQEKRKCVDVVRLSGGLREALRFFQLTDPAISRKCNITGQAVKSAAKLGVVGIEPLGRAMRLYDITTGTGDYISNGVVSHNCYARPSHAYMGLSPGIDFETRLFYKQDAAQVLESQLAKPGYLCKSITLGANTDPYQPVEKRMRVTRSILEVLARTRHPVAIITKSALVLRDLDLLSEMARDRLASVAVSVTTLDADLKRVMEPRTASPQARLRTLGALNEAGIPTVVMAAPMIPALNDHELEAILEAAAQYGTRRAGYVLVRLPYEIKDLFREWLEAHYPQRAAHVMSLVRDMRGGRDNDPRFGFRMRGTGPYAELLSRRFRLACARLGLNSAPREPLETCLFKRPTAGPQLELRL
jgi:DNA repair photolyase